MNSSPIITNIECISCNCSNVTKVGWIITHSADWRIPIIMGSIFFLGMV